MFGAKFVISLDILSVNPEKDALPPASTIFAQGLHIFS